MAGFQKTGHIPEPEQKSGTNKSNIRKCPIDDKSYVICIISISDKNDKLSKHEVN